MNNNDLNMYFTAKLNSQDFEEIRADVDYILHKHVDNIKNKNSFRKVCVKNMEINYYVKKKKYMNFCIEYMKEPACADDNLEYYEQMLILNENIEKLSYMKKWVLQQYFKTGNLAEIARQHNLNENSVKSHYNLAVKQLKQMLVKGG